MSQKIIAIYGMEPMREGEYPSGFQIGSKIAGRDEEVTEIKRRDDNFGDHGIGWFDVYAGESVAISMSLRATAEVVYDYDK